MPESLDRSVSLYERILEAVPGGVVYVAHDGSLMLANQPAQEFLGLKHDEATDRYVVDFATETFNEDGSICPVEDYPVSRCLATGQAQAPRTVGVRHPNGEMKWAVFSALPFRPSPDEPTGAVVSFVDITVRKRAESQIRLLQAELAQRERLATIGTLAAAVAHEVNNPLAFMFLAIENARLQLEDGELNTEELLAELDDVLNGAVRVRDIVRDLMAFSKFRDQPAELSDVNEAIRTAVRIASPELRYKAQITCDLRATGTVAGAGRLSQVVLNLLLNAGRSFREATGEQRVDVTSQNLDGQIVIDVVDNGPGVDLDVMDRIFEPFFTTRDGGTGLGLAISRSLVHELGGTLELVAQAGAGARFRITLPQSVPSEVSTLDRESSLPTAARILLVDDEAIIRRLGAAALAEFDVTVADSVARAVELLDAREFDAVVCDTMLLDGSGVDVFRHIEQHHSQLVGRFGFITGGAFTGPIEAFLADHDELPVLRKPFGRGELHTHVALLLTTTLD